MHPELPLMRQRAFLEAALIFAAALAFFRWQLGQWNGFIDFDGHYHLRVVHWIAHFGWWTDIPWLPFTVLGEKGPDHHWLWHLALVPFAWMEDPAQALRWAAAVNGAATVAVIALVMRLLRVPAAPLFALLAVTAAIYMPHRLLMLRAQNVAVIFMMLSVWAMARERYKTLGALGFLFLESYHAAVILAPLALIGCAARSLEKRRLVLAPLIAVGAGMTLALVLSPWYPRNIEYLLFHVLFKTATNGLQGGELTSLVGTEWHRPGWEKMWLQSWPAHVGLGAALAVVAWRRYRDAALRIPADTLIAIGAAFLSLALYHKAVRFLEYYVPFAALAAGLIARDLAPRAGYRRLHAAFLAAWTALAASVGLTSLQHIRLMPPDHMAHVAFRMNELGEPGDVVFNSAWADFMPLVWWADGFRYINGLDGHYLPYRDPARFAIWLAAGGGALEDPALAMQLAFGARFAVVAREHARLAEQLIASPRAVLHVTSPEGWLFELRRPR